MLLVIENAIKLNLYFRGRFITGISSAIGLEDAPPAANQVLRIRARAAAPKSISAESAGSIKLLIPNWLLTLKGTSFPSRCRSSRRSFSSQLRTESPDGLPRVMAGSRWWAEVRAGRSPGHARLCAPAQAPREESLTRAWGCRRGSPSRPASQTPASRRESASL
jgi:hypothetical protein